MFEVFLMRRATVQCDFTVSDAKRRQLIFCESFQPDALFYIYVHSRWIMANFLVYHTNNLKLFSPIHVYSALNFVLFVLFLSYSIKNITITNILAKQCSEGSSLLRKLGFSCAPATYQNSSTWKQATKINKNTHNQNFRQIHIHANKTPFVFSFRRLSENNNIRNNIITFYISCGTVIVLFYFHGSCHKISLVYTCKHKHWAFPKKSKRISESHGRIVFLWKRMYFIISKSGKTSRCILSLPFAHLVVPVFGSLVSPSFSFVFFLLT